MRWQSVVRVVLALAFVGVGALVYLQLKARPAAPPQSTSAPLSNPQAVSQRESGTFQHFDEAGALVYTIAFERHETFADNRNVFEKATTTFVRNGVRHSIVSDRAEMIGRAGPTGNQPERIVFPSGVRMSAEGGVEVQADGEATYFNVEQKVVIPGPMRFTRGRLSGSGVGADLYMDRSVLWINDQAALSVAPEVKGGTPIEASAKRIGLAEADHYMVLEENAVMTHQSQRLSAQNARVAFAPVGDVVQFIELRGRSAVRSTDPRSERPALSAENINLAFTPDSGLLSNAALVQDARVTMRDAAGETRISGSDIEMFLAPDGETLTRLVATAPVEVLLPRQGDQPAKSIRANHLLAEGDDAGGLNRALFSEAVDYRETRPAGRGQPAAVRTATAGTLALGLKGDLGQVESATFRQNFKVKDGDLTATAQEAQYDSSGEVLKLRSNQQGPRPKVTDPQFDVEANEIDADLRNDAFDARGAGQARVESFVTPSRPQDKARTDVGLFEPGKAVTGTSERLRYSRATGLAQYEGAVYLRQGDSALRADKVDLDDKKSDLRASGSVRSTLALDPATGKTAGTSKTPAASGPTRIAANALTYTDSTRVAVYTGSAVLDSASGERLQGEQVTLTLEPSERKLKTAVATAAPNGEVRVTLLEGRQSAGQRLTYTAATDEYVVSGAPAVFVVPATDRGVGECNIGSGTTLTFGRTQGSYRVSSEGGAVGTMKPVKCAAVIKVTK